MSITVRAKYLKVLLAAIFIAVGAVTAFSSPKKVQLKAFDWDTDYEDVNKQIVANYQKINPNIELTFIEKDFDQYFTILTTMIQSGQAPDLFCSLGWSNSTFPGLVEQGNLLPLNGLFDDTQYPAWLLGYYSFKGKHYAIPGLSEDDYAVYYNKALFSKCGLTVPKSQSDMDHILSTLVKNGVTPISLPGKSTYDMLMAFGVFIQAYAADWDTNFPFKGSRFSDPTFVNATKLFVSWLDKGYFGDQWKALDNNSAIIQVVQGQAATYFNIEGTARTIKDAKDIGILRMKRPDGKDSGITSPRQDLAFHVYAKTSNKDAAIQFAKYFAGKDVQQLLEIAGGGVPSTFPAARGIFTTEPLLQAFAQKDHTEMFFVDKAGLIQSAGQDMEDGMMNAIGKLLLKQISAEEFVAEMDKTVDYTLPDRE